jgi:membrane-associated phospholipid phosphatase
VSTLERVWFAYLAVTAVIALACDGGGMASHRPYSFLLASATIAALQVIVLLVARHEHPCLTRAVRAVTACVATPIAFSSLAWLLPAVHPEPWELLWHDLDRAMFGGAPTVAAQAWLSPLLVEILQLVYATFYFIPITAALAALRHSGPVAFDHAVVILVGSFLASYLGYLLFPTLPPYRYLEHGGELEGLWLAATLHGLLDAAEVNRWDCFPSGHTMLSLCSVAVVWRWARPWVIPFGMVVAVLIASTILLRYHWSWDVFAGAALALPSVHLFDTLWRCDAAPASRQPADTPAPADHTT